MDAMTPDQQSKPVEKHIHAWITTYELVGRITVSRCAFRTCSGVAVHQWEKANHVVTVFPNGDVEILPS